MSAGERIVIDTDPGQDDAVAILLAMAEPERLDLLGLMTVAGNVPVAQATVNALRVCELAAREVPIRAGAEAPLIFPLETAEFVCGPDGLAGAELPPPRSKPGVGHAVEWLVETLRASADAAVTLCALGPLTNVALAIRLAPDILPKIKRLVVMGGAMNLGNMTPAAEFNAYVDPHALAIVLGCGRPITLFNLAATHQAVASAEALAAFARTGTRTAKAVNGMLTRPRPGGLGTQGHPMHDPCVVACLLWPELFAGRDCFVEIETSAGPLRGRTTIDWNNRLKRPPNAHVVGEVQADALFQLLFGALARLP